MQNVYGVFLDFDIFIIQKMGFEFSTKDELEEVRRPAFLKFRKCTGHHNFATLPTMRKWFGIGEFRRPTREQVYEICLTMKTGIEEAETYLLTGLGESSFIFNDYRELIYLYGLENLFSCEECKSMIRKFEQQWNPAQFEEEHRDLLLIEKKFKKIKKENPDNFLEWMLQHSGFFVGYSKEMLDVLLECRNEITEMIRREAKDNLENLLAETDYTNWLKTRNHHNYTPRENLRHYVKMHQSSGYYRVSEHLGKNILELSQMVYSELEANSKLLSEVFSTSPKEKRTKSFHNIKGMTAKHLSDLFNIPLQKKRLYILRKAKHQLLDMPEDAMPSKGFYETVENCTKKHPHFSNVREAKQWLKNYYSEQKRRCIEINRGDILPFIHYISQHRYLEMINGEKQDYNFLQAQESFVVLANKTLRRCHMSLMNKERELDALLLDCFQSEEMYSFAEILYMSK
jgi:hypothetical protein